MAKKADEIFPSSSSSSSSSSTAVVVVIVVRRSEVFFLNVLLSFKKNFKFLAKKANEIFPSSSVTSSVVVRHRRSSLRRFFQKNHVLLSFKKNSKFLAKKPTRFFRRRPSSSSSVAQSIFRLRRPPSSSVIVVRRSEDSFQKKHVLFSFKKNFKFLAKKANEIFPSSSCVVNVFPSSSVIVVRRSEDFSKKITFCSASKKIQVIGKKSRRDFSVVVVFVRHRRPSLRRFFQKNHVLLSFKKNSKFLPKKADEIFPSSSVIVVRRSEDFFKKIKFCSALKKIPSFWQKSRRDFSVVVVVVRRRRRRPSSLCVVNVFRRRRPSSSFVAQKIFPKKSRFAQL